MPAVMARLHRPSALLVAALVLVSAFVALSALRQDPPTSQVPRAVAIRAAQAMAVETTALPRDGGGWTRVEVAAVDRETTRVTFYDGAREIADVGLMADGRVLPNGLDAPGAPLARRAWVLLIGGLAFLLATAVVPLRRVRNLDVLALLALVVPIVLLDARYVSASTLAALPSLAWLAGRCAWRGLGPVSSATAPARPLLDAVTPAWGDAQRLRLLRLAVGAAAAAVVMMTVSARSTIDVAHAVMEGATLLTHGVLPYGHMPGDVFHGDTYPLLSYVAYMPFALLNPVRDGLDLANGALVAAAAAALGGAWLLARRGGGPEASDAERAARLRAALAWLAFPPLVVTVTSGTSDVLLALLLLGALVLIRRPLASTGMLILGGWFKLVPFVLLPLWFARLRGRRLAAALALLGASLLAILGLLVALGGSGAPGDMLHAMAFQLERRSLHNPWELLGAEWLQPLVQAGVLALVAAATVRIRRDPALAQDPARLAALSAAVLLSLQVAGNYWSFLYLAWIMPSLLTSLLATAPQASEAVAPAPAPVGEPALA